MTGPSRPSWPGGWEQGSWLNPPPAAWTEGGDWLVACAAGSDLWRTTSYGFVHDSGHALLAPFPTAGALEVRFVLGFDRQFDQAGLLLRADERTWVKAGVEVSDGVPQVGVVATRGVSDWSVAPVPDWAGREVTVRASRTGDALTVRARVDGEDWRLVRVAPLAERGDWRAGPYCCSPSRDGLVVRFRGAVLTVADASLHAGRTTSPASAPPLPRP